jgi:poly-gamma-glutamate capsule biosynthesis protein CapA/YwtB (metallophosphatase superfamily)
MARKTDGDLLLYAVGDVAPFREDPATIFDHVRDTLTKTDIAFCQLEINISERGTRMPQARHTMTAHPRTASALKNAGFNVVSFAGNHCMDWGQEAFFDTLDALRKERISVVGVGKNIEEARRPAIIESKGNKIAFLAYNTILPMGYWAEPNRPGCAPLRAWTIYEQVEHDQPGTPCRIHTFPNREDLSAMIADIQKAKSRADVVLVSMHFGLHFVPALLAEYQRDFAHAAIDAGADVIIGHHAHILKGIEVYKGKAIFYSLCNFAVDLPFTKEQIESASFREVQKNLPNWNPDPRRLYNFPEDSRKTAVVKCIIADGKLKNVSFLPTYVSTKDKPEILDAKNPHFREVVDYLKEVSMNQGLDTKFVIKGNEVFVK